MDREKAAAGNKMTDQNLYNDFFTLRRLLPIRFRRPEELQEYLENSEKEELIFSTIPISGEPETFILYYLKLFERLNGDKHQA